ncbi:MAG: tetratricopeptide repeat protein [Rhodobacteraceae bacterium]|nr:tetratricopeptide repeat protein [Paracoccaceae bacterium]
MTTVRHLSTRRMRRSAQAAALTGLAVVSALAWAGPAQADLRAYASACSASDLNPSRAIKFCNKTLALELLGAKGQAQVLLNRGVAYTMIDNPRAALSDYDQAAKLYPKLFEIWPNRGEVLMRLRRPAEAYESFDQALRLRPSDRPSLIGRGAALVAAGAPERALIDLDTALSNNPRDATALYNRALAYLGLGRRDLATADLSAVIALAPRSVDARLQRGKLWEEPDRDAALSDYAMAIESAPDDPRAYYQRGLFLDRLGRVDHANSDFRRAWELGWRDEWLHERITSLGG